MFDGLSSTDHIVVAGFTVINDTGMIIEASAKGSRGVANTTILNGRHVGEWFTASFSSNTSVATGCSAIVYDTGMIKLRPGEAAGGMTDATVLVSWYMVAGFPYSERAIMAGSTVIHDAIMREGRGYKTCGLVAVNAITVGWHMVRWRNFSSGSCAVVA